MEEDSARRHKRSNVESWSAITTTDTAVSRRAEEFRTKGETRVGTMRAHWGREVVVSELDPNNTPWEGNPEATRRNASGVAHQSAGWQLPRIARRCLQLGPHLAGDTAGEESIGSGQFHGRAS